MVRTYRALRDSAFTAAMSCSTSLPLAEGCSDVNIYIYIYLVAHPLTCLGKFVYNNVTHHQLVGKVVTIISLSGAANPKPCMGGGGRESCSRKINLSLHVLEPHNCYKSEKKAAEARVPASNRVMSLEP